MSAGEYVADDGRCSTSDEELDALFAPRAPRRPRASTSTGVPPAGEAASASHLAAARAAVPEAVAGGGPAVVDLACLPDSSQRQPPAAGGRAAPRSTGAASVPVPSHAGRSSASALEPAGDRPGQGRGEEAAAAHSVLGEPPFRLTSKPPRHHTMMDPSVNRHARRLRQVLNLRDVDSVVLCNYLFDLGVRPPLPSQPLARLFRPLVHCSDTRPSMAALQPMPSSCAEGKQPRLLRPRFICGRGSGFSPSARGSRAARSTLLWCTA